ncbi:MAG: hypothetical protein K0V04_10735 [Deltaproteobacteria bacterium]|nr:hypothetical protein [Deltaproteobacteria bacterium]
MTDLRSSIVEVFTSLGKTVSSDDAESIVAAGILDSLSVLELVNALETRFDIVFEEDDLTLDNFDKLTTIERIVKARTEDDT